MAFVAASSPKVPANRQYPVASRASGDGPDTAQYGLVWPNEWPNGEIHARDDERARGARDGRDRSYRHGVGGLWKQHERTGGTAGALSGQLAASSPAGSRRRMISRSPYTSDLRAGDARQPEKRRRWRQARRSRVPSFAWRVGRPAPDGDGAGGAHMRPGDQAGRRGRLAGRGGRGGDDPPMHTHTREDE